VVIGFPRAWSSVRWANLVAIVGVCVASAVIVPWRASSAETLGDALRSRGLVASAQGLGNLDRPITSYSVFNSEKEFLITYYLDDGSGALHEPLFVSRYDKVAQTWRSVTITDRAAQAVDVRCLGSAVSIRAETHGFYLGTHLNPSAGCTIVLSRDLSIQTVLPGWVLGVFADGAILYERSQTHFAPTHYAELSLYYPAHRQTVDIYPMKPFQRIRAEHISRVRRVYSNAAWCRAHNHHCDPERFDNFVVGEAAVSDAANALAFQVAFDNTVYWSDVERWRLDSFRGLRTHLPEAGLARSGLSDELFMYLYEDLRHAEGYPGRTQMLRTLEGDRELLDLVAVASTRERRPDQGWRAFFDALDSRWERTELWARLAKLIAVPPEFTQVVYVYRNVTGGGRIEYREVLLEDLQTRFGRHPLPWYLAPDTLGRIFGS
jgi:hypothetical protein